MRPHTGKVHLVSRLFGNLANTVARAAGRPVAFILACTVIAVWGATGSVFHYSDTWQLIVNTGTTIVTFLMVFLIQNSQNRDNAAIQVKLDELIRVSAVKNMFVGIEHLTEEEIEELRAKCEARAKRSHAAVHRASAHPRRATDHGERVDQSA